jgi:hypothetical protein
MVIKVNTLKKFILPQKELETFCHYFKNNLKFYSQIFIYIAKIRVANISSLVVSWQLATENAIN